MENYGNGSTRLNGGVLYYISPRNFIKIKIKSNKKNKN